MSKVRCIHCGEILESKYIYDFKKCGCGKTFIDGGNSYIITVVDAEIIYDKTE